MKLLSVEQARAMWLFPFPDINPSGKYIVPVSVELIKRYKFATVPNIPEAIKNNQGIIFGTGAFTHDKRGEIQVDLGIYNDGFVGDTKTNTDSSEEFLHDIFTYLKSEFGLLYPNNIRKQYLSKIYVETKKSLNSLNPKLERFTKSLTEKSYAFGSVAYELSGINLSTEQRNAIAPPIFRFERAEKSPFSSNRYYSFAGLKTSDHLELVEQFLSILS